MKLAAPRQCTLLSVLIVLCTRITQAAADGALRHRAAGAISNRGTTRSKAKGSAKDEYPSCSCDCCDVTNRLPDEFNAGAGVKCNPSEQHSSDKCSTQCAAADDDNVLRQTDGDVLDYVRFCFHECKPAEGINSPVTTQCIALDETEAHQIVDKDGNAMDPAFLYAKPHPALLASKSRVPAPAPGPSPAAPPGSPDAVDPEQARDEGVAGWRMATQKGADARVYAYKVREHEQAESQNLRANLQEEYGDPPASQDGLDPVDDIANQAPPPPSGPEDPYMAIRDIKMSAKKAKTAAEAAALSAQDALQAVETARGTNWRAALDEAQAEVKRVKERVLKKLADKAEAMKPSKWQVKASAAAEQGGAPFFRAQLQASQLANEYEKRATDTGAQANKLDREAKQMADEANELNRNGFKDEAQNKIIDARSIAEEAQDLSKTAASYVKTAAQARASIPMYKMQADDAAFKAASAVDPSMIPPGVSPPVFPVQPPA